jgi:hypothetical protein
LNNPDHISESLGTIFWVQILTFFDADPGSGMEKIRIRDGKKILVCCAVACLVGCCPEHKDGEDCVEGFHAVDPGFSARRVENDNFN